MDQISNMLTSIRNALAVKKSTVSIPFSNLKYEILKILQKQGFITEIEKKGRLPKKTIEVILKYQEGEPAISGLKRISKSGQRIYKGFKEIKIVRSGFGISIVSTSKGLITDKEARKQKLGGEIICEIW